MTHPDDDARRTERSDATHGGSDPTHGGHEAPPIEQSQEQSSAGGYTPPPAYNPPPSYGSEPGPTGTPVAGYQPPQNYSAPTYPPPPGYQPPSGYQQQSYPPPYPDQGYGSYPPPQYGTAPGGYPPPPYGGYPGGDPTYGGYGAPYGDPYGGAGKPGTNPLAIWSLVLSVVGLCCGLGSIAGIVLGVLAINQIKQTPQEGRGLAIAGIAVGAASLVISIIWTLAVIAR